MTIRFNPHHGLIVIPVELEGPNGVSIVQLAVDTGASVTMIASPLLASVGCVHSQGSRPFQVTTGSGVVSASICLVPRLEALGKAKPRFPVLSHTLPMSASVDGVLGLDFFRGLKLEIDLRSGTIDLT